MPLNFLHYYLPDPIIFSWRFITIRWYGVLIALALLLAIYLALRLARQFNLFSDDVFDLAFWLALSGIIGARAYEVFILNWSYYQDNYLAIVKIWQGGLAIHGAILGGVVALLAWSKLKNKNFWQLADLIAPLLALGQAIGRWGNYFNQELFGRPTNLPWGLPITQVHRPDAYFNYQYFHPVFLYESLLDLLLFVVLFFLLKKNQLKTGEIFLLYLIGYAIIRFATELIRLDQTIILAGARLPQIVSVAIAILAGSILLFRRNHHS
jgi:phosphatidylglycerol:prolipoprotein diacylglycerol transferase